MEGECVDLPSANFEALRSWKSIIKERCEEIDTLSTEVRNMTRDMKTAEKGPEVKLELRLANVRSIVDRALDLFE
jgi:hypothetical protein